MYLQFSKIPGQGLIVAVAAVASSGRGCASVTVGTPALTYGSRRYFLLTLDIPILLIKTAHIISKLAHISMLPFIA